MKYAGFCILQVFAVSVEFLPLSKSCSRWLTIFSPFSNPSPADPRSRNDGCLAELLSSTPKA